MGFVLILFIALVSAVVLLVIRGRFLPTVLVFPFGSFPLVFGSSALVSLRPCTPCFSFLLSVSLSCRFPLLLVRVLFTLLRFRPASVILVVFGLSRFCSFGPSGAARSLLFSRSCFVFSLFGRAFAYLLVFPCCFQASRLQCY